MTQLRNLLDPPDKLRENQLKLQTRTPESADDVRARRIGMIVGAILGWCLPDLAALIAKRVGADPRLLYAWAFPAGLLIPPVVLVIALAGILPAVRRRPIQLGGSAVVMYVVLYVGSLIGYGIGGVGAEVPSTGEPEGWSVVVTGGRGRLLTPLAVDVQGNLYVPGKDYSVEKLSPAGEWLAGWDARVGNAAQVKRPTGIAVDNQGRVYVQDGDNGRILAFSASGERIGEWGGTVPPGHLTGLAVDAAGTMYATHSAANQVYAFAPDGPLLGSWDGPSAGLGRFAVDHHGNIYGADQGNHRIQRLAPGEQQFAPWSRTVQFTPNHPRYLAVDDGGNVYADQETTVIVKLSPSGEPLTEWRGSYGRGPGQFLEISGLAVDGSRSIYVADWKNDRVYRLPPTGPNLAR
jgi:streptogramin lyase